MEEYYFIIIPAAALHFAEFIGCILLKPAFFRFGIPLYKKRLDVKTAYFDALAGKRYTCEDTEFKFISRDECLFIGKGGGMRQRIVPLYKNICRIEHGQYVITSKAPITLLLFPAVFAFLMVFDTDNVVPLLAVSILLSVFFVVRLAMHYLLLSSMTEDLLMLVFKENKPA